MRNAYLTDIASEIVREVELPPDHKSLTRRVRANDIARKFMVELLEDVIQDGQTMEDEAWQQVAKLAGFDSVDDSHNQGFILSVQGNVIQVRKKNS